MQEPEGFDKIAQEAPVQEELLKTVSTRAE